MTAKARLALRAALPIAALTALAALAGCDSVKTSSGPRLQATWEQLSIPPGEVVFRNATPRDDVYEERVILKNIGSATLRINQIALSGDDDHFDLSEDTPEVVELQPDATQDVYVTYKATDLQTRRTSIVVRSTDSNMPLLTIPVRNDDVRARIIVTDCVRATAGATCRPPIDDLLVDFGDVRRGECRTGEIVVENASKADLAVQMPEFEAGSGAEIAFDGATVGDFSLGPVDDNGITQRKVIGVKYCPTVATQAQARIILRSNDPANPEVEVNLVGTSQPIGDVSCTCSPATIEVAPQDTISLNANCTDSAGSPLQYQWTVERRPAGSTEQIRNANTRNASFTANTATTQSEPYVFRVRATNTSGNAGTCTITAYATPRDALHLQLVWDTDTTDVDLHFLNPAGSANPHAATGYFNSPNDNYFANPAPQWGVSTSVADNPRLDLDDVNGFGPENINLSQPASGRYTVGAHYFCDDSRGATRATVRIFCNGSLAQEFGPFSLPRTGFFWDVATIDWPGCRITALNTTRQRTEGCLGFGF